MASKIQNCLHVVRGGERKLRLPGKSVEIKTDGTLWYQGYPILGINDPAEKARVAVLAKARMFSEIPAEHFVRLGDNPNGIWAGDDGAYAIHPAKLQADAVAEQARQLAARCVTIHLSSRGWGDYSPVTWRGDITRPDADIEAECLAALSASNDVDDPSPDIPALISSARLAWDAKRNAKPEPTPTYGPGYCHKCHSYCYGDCQS